MIVGAGTYELQGSESQKAILLSCFTPGETAFIAFPWEELDPPAVPIPIGWMDLNSSEFLARVEWPGEMRSSNLPPPDTESTSQRMLILGIQHAFASEIEVPGHVHIHDAQGNEGHGILRRTNGRWFIAGVFWTDGRIYIDTRCEQLPDLAREVMSAELAHSVDYFLPLSDVQKAALMRLWHSGGSDAHTWWEIHDYGAEYYDLGGEAFMAAFTQAYASGIEPDQTAFTHKTSDEQADEVRAILDIPMVGDPPPPPPPDPVEPFDFGIITRFLRWLVGLFRPT